MRAVVQRVSRAAVVVDGATVAEIGGGLLALLGVAVGDQLRDAEVLAAKLVGLRVFPDGEGKMNRTVAESGGSVLVVSQFTLLADLRKGRRPSFIRAAPPAVAEPLVEEVAKQMEARGVAVRSGRFGAHMEVALTNDGPVTIVIEVEGGKVL